MLTAGTVEYDGTVARLWDGWETAMDDLDGEEEAATDPCEWFVNDATTPSWVCNTHMYDGTGDYPATGEHPDECPFREEEA